MLYLNSANNFHPFMHESCTNAYTLLTYVCILFVLYAAYNRRGGVYSFLRLVMALPFLPHEHIRDAFLDLDDKARQCRSSNGLRV